MRFSRTGLSLDCLLPISLEAIFIQMIVLLASLTVHELAHAWTADRLGDPTARRLGRISLNPIVHADPIGTILFPLIAIISHVPILGWAKPVPVNIRNLRHPRRDYVMVAAAGPASNLVLALGAAVLYAVLPISPLTLGSRLLEALIELNVLLAVFNMIPIPPLDGGNVVAGLLPISFAAAFNRVRPYGFLILYALILSNTLWTIIGPPFSFIMHLLPTQ